MKKFDRVAITLILKIASLVHLRLSENQARTCLEFLKFAAVGVSNTLVFYLLYLACHQLLTRLGVEATTVYLMGQLIAYLLSILWSFLWNNFLVFTDQKTERRWLRTLIKTYLSYSFTGVFLNSLLLYIWVAGFGISDLIAPLINVMINLPINFLINKYWAFN